MSQKYFITSFKNRFATEGILAEKTFEEIYISFKNKVKRTREKYSEYVNSPKQTQSTIKDVGGFIGGKLEGNQRTNTANVITRQILTLDIDINLPNVLEYLKRNVYFYCLIYSTHSHSPNENRYRLVAPLSREVTPDEYEAVGRRVAYQIENSKYETLRGLFDETTFQAKRLMFFPSVSADGEYICELLNLNMAKEEQNTIDVDRILDEMVDKNDIYEWFKPQKVNAEQVGHNALENKNPLKAKGMVGAFNRTYKISQAIDKFLPHIYSQEPNGRYTFIGGESFGGGTTLNEDTLFYSHHGTDPANMYYRSAFDLVRVHLFGKHDLGFTPEKLIETNIIEKTESFLKMVEFCRSIGEVVANSDSSLMQKQKYEKQEEYIKETFSPKVEIDLNKEPAYPAVPDVAVPKVVVEQPETNNSWIVELDGIKSNLSKLDIIYRNDTLIGNMLYYDTFRDNICFYRQPYWQREWTEGVSLQDKDMSHIRVHLEKVYGIKGEKMIDDSIVVEADKIQKNKVLDFFNGLVWDGKSRLDTFFIDFFKVPDNPFTRAAFKHWLVGAVSRIFKAGSPMDYLLVIKGKQGIGKSLFFKKLATIDFNKQSDHLYSDTKIDFDKAKDSYEQLEGIWIYEWKELAGMNMSEQESIKAFVDKTEDKFRRSYGRRVVELKRRVAFCGTTNEKKPLRDRTGNRRFLVLESTLKYRECYIKDPDKFTQELRDQLLAEAVHLYRNDYNIFEWTEEEDEWWERSSEDNLTENDLTGQIESFVNMKRPKHWYSMSLAEMITYHEKYDFVKDKSNDDLWDGATLELATKICIQEIHRVALKQRDITINRFHRELILQALEKIGWHLGKQQQRFGQFGHQYPILPEEVEDKEIDENNLPF